MDELGWEDRFIVNQQFFPNLRVVNSTGNIFQSMNHIKEIATTDLFILIDGDSFLLPECNLVHNITEPSVFYSTNQYGISYGHGGVKVLDKNPIATSGSASDITTRMKLREVKNVISFHDFMFSNFNTWKTLFKELLKLYLWGENMKLHQWLNNEVPKEVFSLDVMPFIRRSTMADLLTIVSDLPRLTSMYQESKTSLFLGENTDTNL